MICYPRPSAVCIAIGADMCVLHEVYIILGADWAVESLEAPKGAFLALKL